MPYRLAWDSEAFSAMQAYRNSDPKLCEALERSLNELRGSGTIAGSGYTSDSFSAHVASVFAPGYREHVIVWIRQPDDRPRVVYVGPLDL